MSEELDFGMFVYYGLAAAIAIAVWALLVRLNLRKPRFSLASLLALTFMVAIAIGIVKLALWSWS
jgi:hypothetical protein